MTYFFKQETSSSSWHFIEFDVVSKACYLLWLILFSRQTSEFLGVCWKKYFSSSINSLELILCWRHKSTYLCCAEQLIDYDECFLCYCKRRKALSYEEVEPNQNTFLINLRRRFVYVIISWIFRSFFSFILSIGFFH